MASRRTRLGTLCGGPIDESQLDSLGERSKSIAQRLEQPDRLENDTAQLLEYRSSWICLKMFLIAQTGDHDQATVRQTPELSLHSAPSGLCQLHELGCKEAALRLTK